METQIHTNVARNKIIQIRDIQFRTSWMFSQWGSNFVKTMLRLGRERESLEVVEDQIGSPTYAPDLVKTLILMAEKLVSGEIKSPGIYHFTNKGICSWFQFAEKILVKENVKLKKTTSDKFIRFAKRPNYSKLDTSKLENTFLLKTRTWQDALAECLKHL